MTRPRLAFRWVVLIAALIAAVGSCATHDHPAHTDWCGNLPPVYGDDC